MWYEGDVKTPARNFGRLVDDGVDEVIAVVLPETESIQQFSDPIWQAALKTWSIYINILMSLHAHVSLYCYLYTLNVTRPDNNYDMTDG
jgi:hypothetical protein